MCNISRQIKLFMYVHFEKSPLIDYSNDLRFHALYMYEDQVYKYVLQRNLNSRISFEIIKLLFKELNFFKKSSGKLQGKLL